MATAVELERALCREPGLVDGGTHLILVGRKGGDSFGLLAGVGAGGLWCDAGRRKTLGRLTTNG